MIISQSRLAKEFAKSKKAFEKFTEVAKAKTRLDAIHPMGALYKSRKKMSRK